MKEELFRDLTEFEELMIFNNLVVETGVDPDEPVHIPMPLKSVVKQLTGASPTEFTPEMVSKVQLLLQDDEAARLWFHYQRVLEDTGQIALPPGPAAGLALDSALRE